MRISAQLSIIMAAIFAAISFGVAITGFTSLGDLTDATQVADAQGYAWFWTFLGFVSLTIGGISVWIVKTGDRAEEA